MAKNDYTQKPALQFGHNIIEKPIIVLCTYIMFWKNRMKISS